MTTPKEELIAVIESAKDKVQDALDCANLFDDSAPCEMPAQVLRTGSADELAVNYYPHSIEFYEGFFYVTTVGVDNLSPPPYISGDTKLVKIDPKTRTVVGQCSAGAFYQAGIGNGMNGFCIHAGKAYVCNNHHINNTTEIVVVDLATMTIDSRIGLGTGASRHCVVDQNGKLWATLADGTEALKRIDLSTGLVDHTISLPGDKPFRLAFFDNSVWLACFNSNKVKRFNPSTGALIAIITVGAAPNWFGWDADGLYIACYTGNTVYKIDAAANTAAILITLGADYPHHPFPYKNEIWVACSGSHYIKVYNRTTGALKKSMAVPQNPPSIACDGTQMAHGCGNVGKVKFHPLDFYYNS